MDLEKKWVFPKIIHFDGVFHYFHHPFWGTPIFGNTQIEFQWPDRSEGFLSKWFVFFPVDAIDEFFSKTHAAFPGGTPNQSAHVVCAANSPSLKMLGSGTNGLTYPWSQNVPFVWFSNWSGWFSWVFFQVGYVTLWYFLTNIAFWSNIPIFNRKYMDSIWVHFPATVC